MYRISTFTILIIPFLILISCSINDSDKSKELLDSRLVLKADSVDKGHYMVGGAKADSTIVYHINMELINHFNDSIKFISMSCSHEDMFVVEDSINFMVHPYYLCWANFPIIISLAPSEVYSKSIMISPKAKELRESISTKIGFRFVQVGSEKLDFWGIVDKYHNRHSENVTIWSNLIQVEN